MFRVGLGALCISYNQQLPHSKVQAAKPQASFCNQEELYSRHSYKCSTTEAGGARAQEQALDEDPSKTESFFRITRTLPLLKSRESNWNHGAAREKEAGPPCCCIIFFFFLHLNLDFSRILNGWWQG